MISNRRTRTAFNILTASCLLLVDGCTVGPNFRPPAAPDVSGYTTSPLTATTATPGVTGGGVQHFNDGRDIPGEWWTLFHSRPLDKLIERALKANPGLKAAQAALLVARENVLAQRGAYSPNVTAGFSASRQKTSAEISPTPASGELNFSLFTPQVSVSYVPDVFGLNRRTVEYLTAEEQQARFALVATDIALSANVVAAAIEEASLRAQIAATRKLVAINANMIQVLRAQYAKGSASALDVAVQESQLAQVTSSLPPLLKQLAQQRDLLAALAGGFPNQDLEEKFDLAGLQLPLELPVSLPSRLVRQRPDVRQAEENLHAASAGIGIAVANRLPNITLTADAGTMALSTSQLFTRDAGFWGVGENLTQPVFDGGILLHRERAARDAYVQAQEQYRSTVITAFENVADTLNALRHDADTLRTAAAAADAAHITLELVRQQIRIGGGSQLALLNAEQSYRQSQISLVQAQASRYTDTAALFVALGGGWWNRVHLSHN